MDPGIPQQLIEPLSRTADDVPCVSVFADERSPPGP